MNFSEITTGLVYCDSGNLIEDHEHEYVYDVFNRLVQVVRKSDSEVIATYRYDTQNRRVKRIVTNSGDLNGTTQYVYDGWQVVEERDGQDAVTATYTYGNYIDEPITLTTDSGTYYYHTNNLYNVRALTDEQGAVVERYRYSAYGEVTILDAGDQEIPASTVGNVYMFQGRRLDPETGLYYYRNRMMSAELGRFLQRDPLGYVDGWNLYEFVTIVYLDPTGLKRFYVVGERIEEEHRDDETRSERLQRRAGVFLGVMHVDVYYGKKTEATLVRVGLGGSIDSTRDISDLKLWELSKKKDCELSWGEGAGENIECASDESIVDCISSAPKPRRVEFSALNNSCQQDVQHAIEGCCLRGYTATGRSPNCQTTT